MSIREELEALCARWDEQERWYMDFIDRHGPDSVYGAKAISFRESARQVRAVIAKAPEQEPHDG